MHIDRSTNTYDGHDTQADDSAVMCWAGVIGRHLTALTGEWSFRGLMKRSGELICLPVRAYSTCPRIV